MLFQFLCQPDADLHAVDEAGAFVVTAEGADRIYDLTHLPQRYAIYQRILFMEILLDLIEYSPLQVGNYRDIMQTNERGG